MRILSATAMASTLLLYYYYKERMYAFALIKKNRIRFCPDHFHFEDKRLKKQTV